MEIPWKHRRGAYKAWLAKAVQDSGLEMIGRLGREMKAAKSKNSIYALEYGELCFRNGDWKTGDKDDNDYSTKG